ncbi:MEKK [Handroanthus impetiginosus]|uniref:mitogen-activated protein kinase kinase kinase n=1 Tax=Handroanthus impetiginosus TaxID=429701 RepID=A0A2G9H6N2_9LAMI|nr:MEKK [Handroanthus impetiginosus]
MVKRESLGLNGRNANSARSPNMGVSRPGSPRRLWTLVSLVFRFVGDLRRRAAMRVDNNLSARSPNMGVSRPGSPRRLWTVVSLVFRFVGDLRRRAAMRVDDNLNVLRQQFLPASDLQDSGSQDNGYLGIGSISTEEEGEVAWASCSDSLSDGQDGFVDPLIDKNGPLLCNKPWNKPWKKGRLIGSGSNGSVYGVLTEDGLSYAVKEVSLLDQGTQEQQKLSHLEDEIYVLSRLQHKNIVRYFGTERDDTKLYIFLELVSKGSLKELYGEYELGDPEVSAYTRQILDGLNYLHSQNVVHRDIKCANILVDASGSVKLADFGLAKVTKMNDIKSCKGSPYWMAPEVVDQKNHNGYGRAADIWSLGCTVLEMLSGQVPYSGLEGHQALFKIGGGELPSIPDNLSEDARDFIRRCLQVNPKDRPTAAQLLEHPFLSIPRV